MGEFCSLRIAPINRDLRDIVDFVDLFPFLNHKGTKSTKERLYVRRVKRRTYIVSPKGQSLLCVPCGFVVYFKQRGILKIARFFKGLLENIPKLRLNPYYAVDTYCDLKNLAATLVSLRFFNPRNDAYCILWVKM